MILEAVLDGLLLALCGLSLLGHSRHKALDWLLPLAYAALCLLSQKISADPMDYLVMPTDNRFYGPFLIIFILTLNSLWYQVQEGHILWGTAAQLALYAGAVPMDWNWLWGAAIWWYTASGYSPCCCGWPFGGWAYWAGCGQGWPMATPLYVPHRAAHCSCYVCFG